MSPLSTVVLPAFRKMFDSFRIKHGDKSLKHLTRNTLKKKIDIIYRENMEIIKNHLKNVQYVCTTADIWTAPDRRFIGVTAHWLCEKSLKRKSAALACKTIKGTHTGEVVATELSRIHALFGLNNEKIVATVTDNGSNFIKAFKIFGLSNEDNDENINESNDLNHDDNYNIPDNYYSIDSNEISNEIDIILPQHLRCASHTLNLIASSDAAKIINDDSRLKRLHEEAIEECDKLWRKLKSPKNREALKKYLKCALKRPVVTRWNSLYDCLKQIISLKDKLTAVSIQQHVDFEVSIREPHFRYIRDYLTCMEPLAVGIDKAQAETTCYYGCLLPLLLSIKNKWTAILRDNRVIYCKKLVEGMQQRLINRFNDFFEIDGHGEAAALAAITHPQFKDRWLSCLSDDKILKIQQLVRAAFSVSEDESNEILDEMEQDDFFDFGEGSTEANRKLQVFTYPGNNSVEMCQFLNNPIRALDVLHQFPRVKQLFIKYNTCIPSSAPVERLFSYATMMNIAKYNRLSDDSFEKRVLSAANMKKRLYYVKR
ncbi:hypothetical protein ALC57_17907 [Trachymyrmex cornetzi]|uniref:HAT C-terminal dimerisation domain-containing protein n=1 Tax=Trachymyrmex cornetzi TaxID=471704 RepID=A0A151ISV7_9HYME|nr:hypothetical protein ALC57_17907 [Trachymyrmex cornetzi]